MGRVLGTCALVLLAGCLQGGPYACGDDMQCRRPGVDDGSCVEGWCAYPDDDCDSELRWSSNAADGVAGSCVPLGGATEAATGSGESTTTVSPTATDPDSTGPTGSPCDDPCTSPPSACWEPSGTCSPVTGTCEYTPLGPGTPCDDDDPCSMTSSCNGAGQCVVDTTVTCDEPPTDCHASVGTCDPIDGACDYDLLETGAPCEDGDPCTEGDSCDGAGACTPGAVCPTGNPCETASCTDRACVYDPVADGSSCGPNPADRCCGGTCVDISTDDANCGGCGLACAAGQGCESVAATSCESNPADTSGRCTCAGATMQCPNGQICRTVTPFANRCTPDSASDCPGIVVQIDLCPDYCSY